MYKFITFDSKHKTVHYGYGNKNLRKVYEWSIKKRVGDRAPAWDIFLVTKVSKITGNVVIAPYADIVMKYLHKQPIKWKPIERFMERLNE